MAFWPFKSKKKQAVTTADIRNAILANNRSSSGASVTHETALKVSVVFACCKVIAEGIAQVPCKVYQENGKTKLPAKEHDLYDILHRQPNDVTTAFNFRETLAVHAVLTGDAFAFINRTTRGRVISLVNIEPGDVTVNVPDRLGLRPTYTIRGKAGAEKEFPAESILHIKGVSWDSYGGMDCVQKAREAIGLSLATESNHARLHKNEAKTAGLLSIDDTLQPDQYKQLKTWIEENYQGENAYSTMILDRGAKYTQMAMTGVDSQHLETRRFQIEDICRFFRVMPLMVMQSDKASTYASAEQMFLAHIVHTLAPWYERLEQAFDTQLLSREDRRRGYYIKFVTQGLLRGALKDTAEYLYRLASIGILTRNECRSLLEFNPLDGLEEPLTPANLAEQQGEIANEA